MPVTSALHRLAPMLIKFPTREPKKVAICSSMYFGALTTLQSVKMESIASRIRISPSLMLPKLSNTFPASSRVVNPFLKLPYRSSHSFLICCSESARAFVLSLSVELSVVLAGVCPADAALPESVLPELPLSRLISSKPIRSRIAFAALLALLSVPSRLYVKASVLAAAAPIPDDASEDTPMIAAVNSLNLVAAALSRSTMMFSHCTIGENTLIKPCPSSAFSVSNCSASVRVLFAHPSEVRA